MSPALNAGARLGLLVDDDGLYLRTLQRSLQKRGLEIVVAQTFQEALAAAENHRPDFALIDLRLGSDSGLGLIEPLKVVREDMRILLVTGYASIATAVEAIKRGADHYLLKPVTAEAIMKAIAGEPQGAAEPESTMVPLARVEWEHIQQALSETQGNVSAAARLLGVHRRSLQRKLAKRPGPERKHEDELE
jgi:two-component system, response regulator RegA